MHEFRDHEDDVCASAFESVPDAADLCALYGLDRPLFCVAYDSECICAFGLVAGVEGQSELEEAHHALDAFYDDG